MLRHSSLCWVWNFVVGKHANNNLPWLTVAIQQLQCLQQWRPTISTCISVFPFNTATLTGYSHAFQSADRSLQGFPFGVWPHLATHAATSLLFWRVRQVLEGLKQVSRRERYMFFVFWKNNLAFEMLYERLVLWAIFYIRIFNTSESLHIFLCIDIGVSTQNQESRCFLTKIIYKSFCSLLMRHHCMWSKTSYLKAKSTLAYKMHWSIVLTLMHIHPLRGLNISRHTCTTQDISHLLQFYRNLPSCAPKADGVNYFMHVLSDPKQMSSIWCSQKKITFTWPIQWKNIPEGISHPRVLNFVWLWNIPFWHTFKTQWGGVSLLACQPGGVICHIFFSKLVNSPLACWAGVE